VQTFAGIVTVKIPYEPPLSLAFDYYGLLTAYWLKDDGVLEAMKGANYNWSTGVLTFKTKHFSKFVIKEWVNPFKDVKKGDWFYEAVKNVSVDGLFVGNGTTDAFAPSENLTRGMIVTLLYRCSGSPAVSGTHTFTDIKSGAYYEQAIIWANENGVVRGNGDGTFAPNRIIARQELAQMMFNYAKFCGRSVDIPADYGNPRKAADWAITAVNWCDFIGLLDSKPGAEFEPAGTTDRATAAMTFWRFSVRVG
jgi:hypothetical protein